MNYVQPLGEPHWRWLASTRRLQEEAYHVDFTALARDPDDLADSIVMNHTALVVELGEFMNEVGWKDWATPRGWINRDAAVGELVDVAHFLANILVRLGVDDDEWESRYQSKQAVNRARQTRGYDARENKCPRCRRSYDDPGVDCRQANVTSELKFGDHTPVVDLRVDAWCGRDHEYVT